ncbi:MAG: hypothetical protein GC159_10400 [Phycisphaera sp.]|nr:hypothetical protein [Phycisphaera sp.]
MDDRHKELDALLHGYFEQTLDDESTRRLDEMLRSDPEARQRMRRYATLRSMLMEQFDGMSETPDIIEAERIPVAKLAPADEPISIQRARGGRVRSRYFRYAAAAVLLIAAGVGVWLTHGGGERGTRGVDASEQTVATLLNAEGAEFADAGQSLQPGDAVSRGALHLSDGEAQLMFDSTAVVHLAGPCVFEATGRNAGRLNSGSIDVYVPEAAHGFELGLPDGSRIVDLGTAFRVSVDDGGATLHVTQGRVAWSPAGADADATEIAAGQIVRITGGAVHVPTETVLLEDRFDGGDSPLNGAAPDVRGRKQKWVAGPGFKCDGSIAGVTDGRDTSVASGAASATLAFAPVAGRVYQLDATVAPSPGEGGWIAVGFVEGQSAGVGSRVRFTEPGVVGRAWVIMPDDRPSDPISSKLGRGAEGNFSTKRVSPGMEALADSGAFDVRIVLDTTGGAGHWTAAFFAKRPQDAAYVQVRATTRLLDERITAAGLAISNGRVAGRVARFSLSEKDVSASAVDAGAAK